MAKKKAAAAAAPKPEAPLEDLQSPASVGPAGPVPADVWAPQGLLDLVAAHRATLQLLGGSSDPVLRVRVHHPQSVERFVAEARACRLVRALQVLSTGIELEIGEPPVEPGPEAES